ncbi:MAG: 2Fe-2S iron-sulfur cluster-binding protein [Bacteroidia bacterium]|nr:2Fe-2S iron-sulfur cluster-binding protein [Bacteroidia bacterium]
MPIVNIDGNAIEFEGKHMLLQFAIDKGIEIPYFCYHPAMSIPTNCRMCLVDVGTQARDRASGEWQVDEEGNPVIMWGRKPNTACNTPLSDRMFVKTHKTSEPIREAQKGVLEFMLINHPLDCPICDQAGECPLQIWTYKYGPEGSRFEATKGHKDKHLELGPNVVLDQERCINCTRCVRFTEEISKTDQLSIVGRGEKNYPSTAPGQSFDDPYSMNTIDICPVGALTSKQTRFKARVWEMANAPAIDMNDSTGTNTFVWVRDNEVIRVTPRANKAINDYWMPDAHRLNVAYYNENRASGVKLKGDIPVDLEDGLRQAADRIRMNQDGFVFIGSPYESLESNFALKQLAANLGESTVYYLPHIIKGYGDNWLIQDDRTPNAAACELLGFTAVSPEEMQAILKKASDALVYSLENRYLFGQTSIDLSQHTVITHATHVLEAHHGFDFVLPSALDIEGEGTYINNKGIPQVSTLAKQIKRMSPEQWMQLPKSRLDKGAVAVDRWRNLDNIFDVLPGWQLIAMVASHLGQDMPFEHHKDIFARLQEEFEILKDLKVSYKPPKSSFKSTQLDFAPAWGSR